MMFPNPLRQRKDDLGRLVATASAVRPITASQRAKLWASIEQRAPVLRRGQTRKPFAVVFAIAFALATLAIVGVHGVRTRGRVEPPTAVAAAEPSAAISFALAANTAAEPTAAIPLAPVKEPSTLQLGSRGELVLWPGSSLLLPPGADAGGRGPVTARLTEGRITATLGPRGAEEPFTIVTPHAQVVVVGTRFTVIVEDRATVVSVERGRVRVQVGGASMVVDAGQTVRSDDPRLGASPPPRVRAPLPPLSKAPAASFVGAPIANSVTPGSTMPRLPDVEKPDREERHGPLAESQDGPCASEPEVASRRACLERAAAAEGLMAENALLALGLLERDTMGSPHAALRTFRDYERKFPHGTLLPEVTVAMVNTQMKFGDRLGACETATRYFARFPHDRFVHARLAKVCDR